VTDPAAQATTLRPDGRGTIAMRLRLALPAPRIALFGALAWATAMAVSAGTNLFLQGWESSAAVVAIMSLFAIGGALAFPTGLFVARFVSLGRPGSVVFAAGFVSLFAATVLVTGGLYAMQYRSYYAEWHGPPLSLRWLFQFAFTSAGALYQFAVLGIRLYFPVGFVALFAAALWFVRQRH
jgi:hypothetical protein